MVRKRTHELSDPLASASKAKTMSGFDYLQAIFEGKISPPPMMATIDAEPFHLEIGSVGFSFEPKEFHYNPIGTVHGGVISTILDSAMGCSLQSILPQGFAFTTLELKINFIKTVSFESGKMKSVGRIIHSGKSTALLEADLRDEAGILYAHGVSTCMIFKIPE
jgi:uncharacterized protein (TIGR00369 family)